MQGTPENSSTTLPAEADEPSEAAAVLTPLQRRFAEEWVLNGAPSAAEAARRAGYAEAHAVQRASGLKKNPRVAAYLRELLDRHLLTRSVRALQVVDDLMERSPDHQVRLRAARDTLDRAQVGKAAQADGPKQAVVINIDLGD